MVGTVKEAVPSFMCPWLVAAQAKALFGKVSVGTELYQWSQTAKPLARPDSTGSAAGREHSHDVRGGGAGLHAAAGALVVGDGVGEVRDEAAVLRGRRARRLAAAE
jgi:hypothetical protein